MKKFDELIGLEFENLSAVLSSGSVDSYTFEKGDWLTLVEIFSARVLSECNQISLPLWRSVQAAFDFVLTAAVRDDEITRRESVIRRVNLSAALLREVSSDAMTGMLDVDVLLNVLFEEIPLSVDEAREMSTVWRTVELDDVRLLRFVKNLLTPVLSLNRDEIEGLNNSRLNEWREVYGLLP